MDSINNLLEWLNNNWSAIVVVAGLILALYEKIKSYLSKSTEEKIAIAKEQAHEIILKLVSEAETDYEDIEHAGAIKRSQVFSYIYEKFPVLEKVISQDELTVWIDNQIDDALDTLRDILEEKEVSSEIIDGLLEEVDHE